MGSKKDNKGQKTHLKIRFCQIKPMTMQGYMQWSKWFRPTLRKKTYHWLDWMFGNKALDVPVERLSSKEAIGDLACELLFEGEFLMYSYTRMNKKCRYKVRLIKKAKITIIDSEDGLHAKVVPNYMNRYWFWKG